MEIEQLPPNKPNFLLVVLLAVAFLFLFFVLAYLFIDFDGHSIHIRHHRSNPNAQLLLPMSHGTDLG